MMVIICGQTSCGSGAELESSNRKISWILIPYEAALFDPVDYTYQSLTITLSAMTYGAICVIHLLSLTYVCSIRILYAMSHD